MGREEVRAVESPGGPLGVGGWRWEDTQTSREGRSRGKDFIVNSSPGEGDRTVEETTKNSPGGEKWREAEMSILFSMVL